MRLGELLDVLQNSYILRIIKNDEEIYTGYLAKIELENEEEKELFEKYKDEEVKLLRCVPEITHKRWKELNLKRPFRPEETPDFSFNDLQLKLYYMVYL